MPKTAILVFALFGFFALAPAAFAATKPSKESLMAAWEQAQKTNENTRTFEKTSDKSVYAYETTYFPYKGRLKVINALVDNYDGYESSGELYQGIIETELPDAAQDIKTKYAYSYAAWQQGNRFYYDENTASWFPVNQWAAHFAAQAKPPADCAARDADGQKGIGGLLRRLENSLLSALSAMIWIVIALGVALLLLRKFSRKAADNQKTMMDRQAALLKIAEENIALQREQAGLLKSILEKLKP